MGKIIKNNKLISKYFIEHFLTITDIITNKMKIITNKDITCPMKYLHKSIKTPFLNIVIKHTSQIEIEIEKLQYLWVWWDFHKIIKGLCIYSKFTCSSYLQLFSRYRNISFMS